jgi:hypothetical protein
LKSRIDFVLERSKCLDGRPVVVIERQLASRRVVVSGGSPLDVGMSLLIGAGSRARECQGEARRFATEAETGRAVLEKIT